MGSAYVARLRHEWHSRTADVVFSKNHCVRCPLSAPLTSASCGLRHLPIVPITRSRYAHETLRLWWSLDRRKVLLTVDTEASCLPCVVDSFYRGNLRKMEAQYGSSAVPRPASVRLAPQTWVNYMNRRRVSEADRHEALRLTIDAVRFAPSVIVDSLEETEVDHMGALAVRSTFDTSAGFPEPFRSCARVPSEATHRLASESGLPTPAVYVAFTTAQGSLNLWLCVVRKGWMWCIQSNFSSRPNGQK